MFHYKVFIWWNDGGSSEWFIDADSSIDAENQILDGLSGTHRDAIISYYSEMVEVFREEEF
jgi:hypothetical protein